MKKHSPNFHQNLHEAETAQYHWGRTAALIFALAAVLMLAFTSCTKEVSKPSVQLRLPSRPPIPVVVTVQFFDATYPTIKRPVYGLRIMTDRVMPMRTEFSLSWKDSIFSYALVTHIDKNDFQRSHSTMLVRYQPPREVKLNRVSGDTTLSYQLKVIP